MSRPNYATRLDDIAAARAVRHGATEQEGPPAPLELEMQRIRDWYEENGMRWEDEYP